MKQSFINKPDRSGYIVFFGNVDSCLKGALRRTVFSSDTHLLPIMLLSCYQSWFLLEYFSLMPHYILLHHNNPESESDSSLQLCLSCGYREKLLCRLGFCVSQLLMTVYESIRCVDLTFFPPATKTKCCQCGRYAINKKAYNYFDSCSGYDMSDRFISGNVHFWRSHSLRKQKKLRCDFWWCSLVA